MERLRGESGVGDSVNYYLELGDPENAFAVYLAQGDKTNHELSNFIAGHQVSIPYLKKHVEFLRNNKASEALVAQLEEVIKSLDTDK